MIGKRGKLLILVYIICLAVLFLMCSTDLIIGEPEKEIYQVAVIIEDVGDDNYSNFRKGMDQAAVEFNADVRFITLYDKQDNAQQMELISREQQDGADALIVAPVDEGQVVGALAEKQVSVPVILLDSGLTGEEVAGVVMADYKKMGQKLADEIADREGEGCRVLVLSDGKNKTAASRLFVEGAAGILERLGLPCHMVISGEGQVMKSLLEAFGDTGEGPAVILAESPELLAEAAAALAEGPSFLKQTEGLYGRGNTMQILNYLDRGLITGVCVTDGFSTGYFSVRMAIEAIEGLRGQAPMEMEVYYIEKEDLRDPAYEKILFPIE